MGFFIINDQTNYFLFTFPMFIFTFLLLLRQRLLLRRDWAYILVQMNPDLKFSQKWQKQKKGKYLFWSRKI